MRRLVRLVFPASNPNPAYTAVGGRIVSVELTADATEFVAALERAAIQLGQIRDRMQRRREVRRAGAWAREYVRGGLDPTITDVDAELRELLRAYGDAEVAAAFLAGWVTHRRVAVDDQGPLVWHRLLGTTTVEVVAA